MVVEKQQTGFKFGKYRTEVIRECGEALDSQGRSYRLVLLQVDGGTFYYSLRLYNAKGKFIKQFLFPLEMAVAILFMLRGEINGNQRVQKRNLH